MNLEKVTFIVTQENKREVREISEMELKDINIDIVGRAMTDFAHGKLESALALYEKFGIDVFRQLPEKFWKIKKKTITLYRGLSPKELEEGPVMFGRKEEEKKIQRLTSWSWNRDFASEWAGIDGYRGVF